MITTYEIRNVLRVYGNHLKKRSIHLEDKEGRPYGPADLVDISIDARRKQMLNRMSSQLISQVVPMNYERRPEILGQNAGFAAGLVAQAPRTRGDQEELI